MAEGQVTEVVEEYLETIYRLQMREGDGAKTNEIVKTMKVVPGTVTNTIERLEKDGLVEHVPYRGVKLTEKGRKIALQVVRRHRLSERLLTDILHVDWSKAHETACKFEHDIADEEIMGKIEEALGNPKTCPHGNPIPSEDGYLAGDKCAGGEFTALADLTPSEVGIVVSIRDEDVEALQYFSKVGLVPGASVEVVGKKPNEGLVTVRVGGSATNTVTEKMASAIEVREETASAHAVEHSKGSAVPKKPSNLTGFDEYES